jgi:hypothetical protein
MTPAELGEPLVVVIEHKAAVPIAVLADVLSGNIVIRPINWPWLRLVLPVETALELSLHLVSRVSDLSHNRRRP